MNLFIVSGNLTRDPEQRNVGDKTVTTFSIAASSGYGEHKKTFFPRVSLWGARGNSIMRFCHKGSKVTVTGEITPSEFTGRDGKTFYNIEIRASEVDIFFDSRSNESGSAQADRPKAPPAPPESDEDELPF